MAVIIEYFIKDAIASNLLNVSSETGNKNKKVKNKRMWAFEFK